MSINISTAPKYSLEVEGYDGYFYLWCLGMECMSLKK